jgi:ABC-2 type transport system permease protein
VNGHAIAAIVRKDLATVVRNRGVRIPLLVTPIVILVLLPVLLVGGGSMLVEGPIPMREIGTEDEPGGGFLGEDRQDEIARGATGEARWAIFVLEVFLAPLYLLVPLLVATVIAADSFAGERDRRTLEALLHTATTDRELLTAKFLAAWLPAMTVSLVGFVVYSVLANVLAYPSVGQVFFPTPTWLLLAFWVTPPLAGLGMALMVIASSRVKSLQAAHQIGSLVVLPILVLLVAQVTGALLLDVRRVVLLGAFLWIAAAASLVFGVQTLRRQRLAVRL